MKWKLPLDVAPIDRLLLRLGYPPLVVNAVKRVQLDPGDYRPIKRCRLTMSDLTENGVVEEIELPLDDIPALIRVLGSLANTPTSLEKLNEVPISCLADVVKGVLEEASSWPSSYTRSVFYHLLVKRTSAKLPRLYYRALNPIFPQLDLFIEAIAVPITVHHCETGGHGLDVLLKLLKDNGNVYKRDYLNALSNLSIPFQEDFLRLVQAALPVELIDSHRLILVMDKFDTPVKVSSRKYHTTLYTLLEKMTLISASDLVLLKRIVNLSQTSMQPKLLSLIEKIPQ